MKTLPSLALLLPLLAACPASEATPPTDDDVGDDTTDADATSDTGETGDTTDTGTDTGETGETGDECVGPDGCFACEPVQPTEFLNACSDATCEAFPNTSERLPLLERDGTLPPLP